MSFNDNANLDTSQVESGGSGVGRGGLAVGGGVGGIVVLASGREAIPGGWLAAREPLGLGHPVPEKDPATDPVNGGQKRLKAVTDSERVLAEVADSNPFCVE